MAALTLWCATPELVVAERTRYDCECGQKRLRSTYMYFRYGTPPARRRRQAAGQQAAAAECSQRVAASSRAGAAVSHSCACIGSPCLSHCVHGASIGGGAQLRWAVPVANQPLRQEGGVVRTCAPGSLRCLCTPPVLPGAPRPIVWAAGCSCAATLIDARACHCCPRLNATNANRAAVEQEPQRRRRRRRSICSIM
jgi:hypothetical protein